MPDGHFLPTQEEASEGEYEPTEVRPGAGGRGFEVKTTGLTSRERTMTSYNARIEYKTRDSAIADRLVTAMRDHHAAVSISPRGFVEATITLPAQSLRQATVTALALADAALAVGVLAVAVLPTDEFDMRLGLLPLPELISVTQAAEKLGVSRSAVLQRLESGSLSGQKVGHTWVVPADAVVAGRQQNAGQRTS